MKTEAELKKLKFEWTQDPCWDIENTHGFDDHFGELKTYRLEMEGQWAAQRHADLMDKALELGCPGNIILAKYVERLELALSAQIERLEDRLDRLEDPS